MLDYKKFPPKTAFSKPQNQSEQSTVPLSPEIEGSAPMVLRGPGQFSHSNILRLQQTVGNQAVMRLLSNRANSASASLSRTNSLQRSMAPTGVIQRKGGGLTSKELAASRMGSFVNSTWSKIQTAYKDYMAASDPEKELHYIKKLENLVEEWKNKAGNEGKAGREDLVNRLEAMVIKEFPEVMAKAIGLPPALIQEIAPKNLNILAAAAEFLEQGLIGKADEQLAKIAGKIPGFPLIKGMLLRRYIGQVNPEMAEAMTNKKFSNATANEGDKTTNYARKTGGDAFVSYLFNQNHFVNVDKYAGLKLTAKNKQEFDKRTNERLTKMYRQKDYAKLSRNEIQSLTAYSAGTYKVINTFLRDNMLPGNNPAPGNQNAADQYEDSTAENNHLIGNSSFEEASALAGNHSEEDPTGREADLNEMALGTNSLEDSTAGNKHLIGNSSEEESEALLGNSSEEDLTGRETDLNVNEMAEGNNSGEESSSEGDESESEDTPGGANQGGKAASKALEEGRIPYTKTAISALNKLKPYKGKVFRHAKDFPGYSEVNRVGAIVTDMGFTSSTYLANSLSNRFGTDIMEIIYSKNGKFIKPISLLSDEDEVLFKPGTRFRVTKRYNADQTKTGAERWSGLDPDIENDLKKDPYWKSVFMLVVKEEV